MSDTSEIKWEYKQQRIDAWKLEEKDKLFNDLGNNVPAFPIYSRLP